MSACHHHHPGLSEPCGSWEVTATNFTITQHLPAKNITVPYKDGFNLGLSFPCSVLSGELWGLLGFSAAHSIALPDLAERAEPWFPFHPSNPVFLWCFYNTFPLSRHCGKLKGSREQIQLPQCTPERTGGFTGCSKETLCKYMWRCIF